MILNINEELLTLIYCGTKNKKLQMMYSVHLDCFAIWNKFGLLILQHIDLC